MGWQWDLHGFTLWLFNIGMENGPFTDGLPIQNQHYLVGGFNHLEKYESQLEGLSHITIFNFINHDDGT